MLYLEPRSRFVKAIFRPKLWLSATIFVLAASSVRADAEFVQIFNDGFNGGNSCLWSIGPSTCPGPNDFQVASPEVSINPGQEITYCYYFRTPNEATRGIHRFVLELGSVVHDAAVFATYNSIQVPTDRQTPGTMSAVDCGFEDTAATGTVANWVFGAHHSGDELVIPADDGTGTPLAMEIVADQPMFMRIHFINPTGSAIANTVTLTAQGLADAVAYTRTESYLAYNDSFSIGAGMTGTATGGCDTPIPAHFWWLSTETHQFATEAKLKDGASVLVTTSNWQSPAIATFAAPAFLDFASLQVTYTCNYSNTTGGSLTPGNSPTANENCIAIGYFFPATRPFLCFGNGGPE
ncbi:MAG: hypothetical protein ABI639_06065 [Thermoanaerobaculia bacterium]